jgi:hypothetical protein
LEGDLGIGVDGRLPIDAPHALERAHVERVLRHTMGRTLPLELAMHLLVELAFSSAATCASVRTKPSCALLPSRLPLADLRQRQLAPFS